MYACSAVSEKHVLQSLMGWFAHNEHSYGWLGLTDCCICQSLICCFEVMQGSHALPTLAGLKMLKPLNAVLMIIPGI